MGYATVLVVTYNKNELDVLGKGLPDVVRELVRTRRPPTTRQAACCSPRKPTKDEPLAVCLVKARLVFFGQNG